MIASVLGGIAGERVMYYEYWIPSAWRGLSAGISYGATSVPQPRVVLEPGALQSTVRRLRALASLLQGLCARGFPVICLFPPPPSWAVEG